MFRLYIFSIGRARVCVLINWNETERRVDEKKKIMIKIIMFEKNITTVDRQTGVGLEKWIRIQMMNVVAFAQPNGTIGVYTNNSLTNEMGKKQKNKLRFNNITVYTIVWGDAGETIFTNYIFSY